MEKQHIERVLDSVIERLAEIEHERWSHWQDYMHSRGVRQADGSLIIPPDLVKRWDRQMATAYAELSETERESDRDQVRKYLGIIKGVLLKS